MPKPNILFILHLPPPVHGASVIGKQILESKAIAGHFNADFINLSTSSSVAEIGKWKFSKAFSFLSLQRKVISALTAKKYDLCYLTLAANGPAFYKDFVSVAILKLFKQPIIFHFHNKGLFEGKAGLINNLLYKSTFENTKSIFLSERLFAGIGRYITRSDAFFCPNGISDIRRKRIQQQSAKSQKSCRLLFFSNMMFAKGVFVLLDACVLLKGRGIDFVCDFAGEWTDITSELFEARVQKADLGKNVFAHGKRYGADKLELFNNAEIFVHPTLNDCFPLVLLEAMQHNLPIVTTDEGAIADMVINGENGFVVQKNDPDVLAEKIELLIRQPELRTSMAQAGRQRYQKLFSLKIFEKNLVQIFKKAIREQS